MYYILSKLYEQSGLLTTIKRNCVLKNLSFVFQCWEQPACPVLHCHYLYSVECICGVSVKSILHHQRAEDGIKGVVCLIFALEKKVFYAKTKILHF